MRPSHRQRKGFALLAILGYTFVLTILGTAFLRTLHLSLDQQHSGVRESKAYAIAESGIQYAALQLQENPAYSGAEGIAMGEYHVDVSIQQDATPSTWVVRSSGFIGDAVAPLHTVVLEARLHKTAKGWTLQSLKRLRRYELIEEKGS